jgi:hypothetical protein
VQELGIELPESLEGWADFFPRYTTLPWLNGRSHARVQRMREYLRLAFHRVSIGKDRRQTAARALHQMISVPARWRLDHDFYELPVELWLKDTAQRFFEAPKPVVDAQQLSSEPATC